MELKQKPKIADLQKAFASMDVEGSIDIIIDRIALINFAGPGDAIFVDDVRWLGRAIQKGPSVIILTGDLYDKLTSEQKRGKTFLVDKEPYLIFEHIVEHYLPVGKVNNLSRHQNYSKFSNCEISEDAWISSTAVIGEGTTVYPYVFIGSDVKIGSSCEIYPGARILSGVKLGNGVTIHPNAVIGSSAFFYKRLKDDGLRKFPARGNVTIGQGVEIGAGVCIDRGILEDTIIESDTKIDNLVQIGHGVRIGMRNIIVGQTGIAGHVKTGSDVYIKGQVGVAQNVEIASNSIIQGKAGVSRNIKKAGIYAGTRARPALEEAKRQKAITLFMAINKTVFDKIFKRYPEVDESIRKIIEAQLGYEADKLTLTSRFDDFDLDSLDFVELKLAFEEAFEIDIPDEDMQNMQTFGDVLRIVIKQIEERESLEKGKKTK